jgi:hypothetical protein
MDEKQLAFLEFTINSGDLLLKFEELEIPEDNQEIEDFVMEAINALSEAQLLANNWYNNLRKEQ